MNERDVYLLSEQTFKRVVDQIKDDQWDQKVDPDMTRTPDATLRTVINNHAIDEAWVPDVLAGKTIEEVGDTHKGDLLGDDPKGNYAKITEKSQEAVKAFTDFDKQVHLSYGDFSAKDYFIHVTSYKAFQAYSIAHFIGADTALPAELVDGLYDEFLPLIDDLRGMGVFGSEVAVPEDADKQTKLLGLTGFYRA